MAYRMLQGEGVAEGVRRIAREEIDAAIADIAHRKLTDSEKVHEVRKRCKKLRALLRLVRPCLGDRYAHENAYFRDTARLLAPLRDGQIVIDAYDLSMDRFDREVTRRTFAPVRRWLVRRKHQGAGELTDLHQRFDQVRDRMSDAREYAEAWPIELSGVDAWRGGFERTYRRARKAMTAAYEGAAPERFHEWRKSVKDHWYHTRVLRPLWDRPVGARGRAAGELGELLGLHHDLAVLRAALLENVEGAGGRPQVDRLVALIGRHRAELENEATPLGTRLFAEKPARIAARYVRYWDAWQEEQRSGRPPEDEPVAASG